MLAGWKLFGFGVGDVVGQAAVGAERGGRAWGACRCARAAA